MAACDGGEVPEGGVYGVAAPFFRDISFEEALTEATGNGLPVFVTVQSPLRDRSGPALDREYWTDAGMAEMLGARTVPLRIIADESPDFVADHKVWFFPTILIFGGDGEIKARIQGMRDVESLRVELARLLDYFERE